MPLVAGKNILRKKMPDKIEKCKEIVYYIVVANKCKEQHMAKKVHQKSFKSNEGKTIYNVIVLLISAFMLIIPFYQGLFFRTNYIPAVALVSIIFAAYMLYKLRSREYRVLDTNMDLSVLLLPVVYFIAFFFAANAKDALDMVLIYCSYFMLYKLSSDLSAKDEKYKNVLLNVIIASTFILSFASMLNIAGIVDIKGAFEGKRLFGLYQYPNTTASVLGVGIILSLNKLIGEKSTKIAAIYQMILTALISTFIFTLSRGGYLVLAGVLLLNFLLISAGNKLKMLLGIFVAFLSSSLLIYKFYALPEDGISAILGYYLISIIASAVIIYGAYMIKNRIKLAFSDKAINVALAAAAVAFIGIAAFLFSVKEPIEYRVEHGAEEEKSWRYEAIYIDNLTPDSEYNIELDVKASMESPYSYGIILRSYNSANELTELLKHFENTGPDFTRKSFDFSTLKDTERVLILLYNYETNSYTEYKNIIIKDSDNAIAKRIEKLKYVPQAIANRLTDINLKTVNVSARMDFVKDGLKVIKDYPIAGAGGGAWKNLYRQYQSTPYNTTEVHNFYVQYGTEVGIIGLIALLVLLLLLVISMIKSIRAGSPYLYVYLAAMLILLHSTIDFNLSLAAVGYVLWMLTGIINSDGNTPMSVRLPQKYTGAIALALSLIVFLASSSVYYGIRVGTEASRALRDKKDIDEIMELYKKASKFDKYNGAYRIDLAQVMNNQLRNTKENKYYEGIMEQISLIKKYEPYNHQYTPVICNIYLSTGKFDEAVKLADHRLKEEPMVEQSYVLKTDVSYEIANYYLKENKIEESIPYLEKIIEASRELEEINKGQKTPIKPEGDYTKKLEAAQRTLEMIKSDIGE